MSSHTQDLLADPRCSVTIASKEFKGAADGRVNLMGKVTLVKSEERDAMKEVYLAKHPGAFWVDLTNINKYYSPLQSTQLSSVSSYSTSSSSSPSDMAPAVSNTSSSSESSSSSSFSLISRNSGSAAC